MKFALIQHIFIECPLCARDSARYWECNRDQQHKLLSSLESTGEDLHSMRNRRKHIKLGTVETFGNTYNVGEGLTLVQGSKLPRKTGETEKGRMKRSSLLQCGQRGFSNRQANIRSNKDKRILW